jgi:uncharacterized protein YxjI
VSGGEKQFLILKIDGHVLSIGDELTFLDASGREIGRISQELLALCPSFKVSRAGQVLAVVRKDLFNLFRCSFTVDVPGPDDLEAAGNLLEHEYEFSRRGRVVARVSKALFSFTDSYCIDVAEGEDAFLIVASAVVIDLCCHADHENK